MNERIRGEQENHIKITLKSCFAVIKFSSEIVYTCNASPCNFINRKKTLCKDFNEKKISVISQNRMHTNRLPKGYYIVVCYS